MINYLRNAVEQMREHYIERLISAGVFQPNDQSLYSLTLTELEYLVKRINRQ